MSAWYRNMSFRLARNVQPTAITRSTIYRGILLPASVPIRIRFDRFVIRLNDCSIPWSRIISLKQYNFTRIVIKFGQLHRLPSSVKNMLKVRRSKGEAPTVAVMDIDLETHERAQEFLEHLVSLGCVRVVYGFLRWNKRYVPVMFTSVSMDSM